MDFIVWSLKHFKAIWRVLIVPALSVPSSHKSLPKKTEYRYPERDIARLTLRNRVLVTIPLLIGSHLRAVSLYIVHKQR